jgi:ABC-type iron transport system FetAB permease component
LAMTLFLALIIVAVVLGIIGAVAEGLGYLLVIAIVLFVATVAVVAQRWSRGMDRGKRRRTLR